jgi:hypothetical protein
VIKVDEFKKELIELMKKHGVHVDSFDQYNGSEEYCGTEYYFAKIDGSYSDMISIDELK